jgi:hypothetical protein
MNEPATEISTPEDEGPASLHEALTEAFNENIGEEPTEEKVTDILPTEDEPELDTSDELEAEPESSEEQSQEEETVILAPEHWSDEDKATFTELPAQARTYLLKREKQYEQGIQSKSEELRPMQEAFGPYAEMMKMRGIDAPTAIRTWVAAQSALDTDPVNGLSMLIQSYGPEVKSALLRQFGAAEEQAFDDDTDPEVRQLREELNRQKRQGQQAQLQQQTYLEQQALEQVRQFKEAVDDDGNLLHPHFEQAQQTMRALLSSGQVPDIESAYEQAIWSVPEYRDEFAEQQRKAAEKEQTQKRAKAAEKAKKAGKTVQGNGSKPPPKKVNATLHEDLQAAWDNSVRGER